MAYLDKLASIQTCILDVDGVLTDGSVYIQSDGSLLRKMNVKDGFAIRWALSKGIQFVVITGGRCEGVKKRLEGLGVEHIYLGIHDKKSLFDDLVNQHLEVKKYTSLEQRIMKESQEFLKLISHHQLVIY